MNKNYGTLLVVDDNPAILTAVKISMSDIFQHIITLNKPDTIPDILTQESVDVILMDMNFTLGVNSGQEGMMWLQAINRRFSTIPIVLITAYADVKLAVRALKCGAADFVTKPWDNDELARVLKDAIDKSRDVKTLEEVESEHVSRALKTFEGNMSKTAEKLGITRQTLYRKMK